MTEAQRTRLLVALEMVQEVMKSAAAGDLNQRQGECLTHAERVLQCSLVGLGRPYFSERFLREQAKEFAAVLEAEQTSKPIGEPGVRLFKDGTVFMSPYESKTWFVPMPGKDGNPFKRGEGTWYRYVEASYEGVRPLDRVMMWVELKGKPALLCHPCVDTTKTKTEHCGTQTNPLLLVPLRTLREE